MLQQRAEELDGTASPDEQSYVSSEVEETITPRTNEDDKATVLEILKSIPGIQQVSLEEGLPREDAHALCERRHLYPYSPVANRRCFP